MRSAQGIDEVPGEFIKVNMELINRLNNEAEFTLLRKQKDKSLQTGRRWVHKSVRTLIKESDNPDPVDEIKIKARKKVIYALQNGWDGPPYSAIELAKLLKIEIAPNDSIPDARTIAKGKDKFIIEYNPYQKPARINFSVSHEIAHTFFSDCFEQIRNREEDPVENRELEQLCNIAASELQLPYVVFPGDANKIKDITIDGLLSLSQKYKTSLEATLLGFIAAIDRPCGLLICTLVGEGQLSLDYHKESILFAENIPSNFIVPQGSKAYYCNIPGSTERETVNWPFLKASYNAFYIGISPMRKESIPRVAIVLAPATQKEKLQDSKISIEFGDATKPRGIGKKIIAQVVNTSGGLGFGFGKSLAKNYPIIKERLKQWKEKKINWKLGNSQMIQVSDDVCVYQMLAQNGLFVKNGKIPLDYNSLQTCLSELREHALVSGATVHMPLIGAGQAKGKWEIIEGMVYSELVNQNVKVQIYLFGTKRPDDFQPSSSLSLFNEESTWLKEK